MKNITVISLLYHFSFITSQVDLKNRLESCMNFQKTH